MNFGSGGGGNGGGGNAVAGPDLEQIDTEQLAFQSASGEDKLRLLPSAWPSDRLPPPTSSLLSVAPTTGLVAAAGPDCLVIASTDSVRHSFTTGTADGNKIKSFIPQATLQIPRVSQVAFSSDESCLVIAAEQGGGLAVYDSKALMNGGQQPAFQLATEGHSVRQLLPNPNPAQELSRYFGVVTENGELLLADLKEQKLVTGSNGSAVFHGSVTCACWSRLGKQIVAGLANGTAVQIDQQGVVKAEIPEPPQLAEWKDASATAHPVTSIFWLETYDFLIIHTPVNPPNAGGNDDSIYHLAHRDKTTSSWTFSRFNDPCLAFGMERKPAQHFIQRLREWQDLQDLLVLSSTASADIGVFTRSKSPLDPQHPVTDAFTCTQPPDNRRAAMPMAADGDTSPIGMAIDLSVKEKIPRPIPNDETLEQSPIPLPALYVLNNEGLLSMWYIIYNEAVRQAKPYPDLVAAGGPRALGEQKQQQQQQQQPATMQMTTPTSPFGANNNAASPFGQPQQQSSATTFGTPSRPTSTFGQPSAPAFGRTSSFGTSQSPWTTNPKGSASTAQFSQPAFGSSTFGQASGIGMNKSSVWGTPQSQQSQQTPSGGSIFGGNAAQASPFMNLGNQSSGQSGFASLSKETQSPFAAASKATPSSGSGFSAFGKENQPSPFASAASKPSLSAEPSGSTVSFGTGMSFGSESTNFGVTSYQSSPTPTPQQAQSREESMADNEDEASDTATLKGPSSQTPAATDRATGGPFGLGASGFKLGSTFKPDGSAKDDLPPPKETGAGLFGKGFGAALSFGDNAPASDSTPAIKKEPGTEEEPNLNDIPPAEPVKADEKPATPVDDAPLPPDPTTWKPKPGALPPPIPPGFGADFVKPAAKQQPEPEPEPKDAPLPTASPAATAQDTGDAAGQPLAGSPPVDLGVEKFSEGQQSSLGSEEAAGPPESEDDEGDWSDEEEGEEGSEEGEVDEEEENVTPKIIDQKGLSAFEARLTPASPKRAEQQKQPHEASTTPTTASKKSYTPAGLPKAPVIFPPPQRSQESPRSPSPQRSATSPVRNTPSSFSASPQPAANKSVPLAKPASQYPPPHPSQPRTGSLLAGSGRTTPQSRPTSSQTQVQPQRIAVPPTQLVRPEKSTAIAKPVEPETGELEDDEDARIQAILAAPIEPTRDVPSFLAHQDYVSDGREKEGLGGQIERVFRDINSMIDTLALNARSLRGFVEGNGEMHAARDRSRLDLEEEEDWALGEVGSLEGILRGIDVQLEDGRVEDARVEIEALREDESDVGRLRGRLAEARKQIAARTDPEQLAQRQAAPLPMETQAQQSEIRQGVQSVQRLLAKAEEELSVLRAELASVPKNSGADGKSSMPTVEAVMNTILKMTAMVEKKSGDIDVLEAQIKRLGGPAALGLKLGYEDDLAASMKASKLSHGSPAALRNSRASVYGSPAAPRMRASRSTPIAGGTPGNMNRRSLFDVSDAEVEAYRFKREGRKKAMERLREQLETRGPRVVKVGR